MESLNDNSNVEPNRESRRVFRLRIPPTERVIASIGQVDLVVLEISEFGLVVKAIDVPHHPDGSCRGVIRWDGVHTSDFTGQVGDIAKGGRVIKNVTGITMRDMVRQQRKLINRYPAVRLWKKP